MSVNQVSDQDLIEVKAFYYPKAGLPKTITAKELSEKTEGKVSEERIVELTLSGHFPCIWYDGKNPNYILKQSMIYIRDYLLSPQIGKKVEIKILKEPSDGKIKPEEIPKELSVLDGLCKYDHTYYKPCVYFLIRDKVIVYIGQSVNLPNRISSHEHDKFFDEVYYIAIPKDQLLFVESELIKRIKPIYNSTHGSPRRELEGKHDPFKEKEKIKPTDVLLSLPEQL